MNKLIVVISNNIVVAVVHKNIKLVPASVVEPKMYLTRCSEDEIREPQHVVFIEII